MKPKLKILSYFQKENNSLSQSLYTSHHILGHAAGGAVG
jgi:hypothetical protein